ncbi:MAG TPA: FoF1 ATP synthase subunit a [Candidatus Limnocylindrales bacterium]|nr:FoF1 ATP synthase subunit a [Candidatus Limnocylindrales bacterium]
MSSEQVATEPVAETPASTPPAKSRRRPSNRWLLLIAAVIALDVVAFVAFPPFPTGGAPGDACAFPACFIESSLEFPAPHTVIDLAPDSAPSAADLVTFHPSISSTLLTMWLVMALVIVGSFLMIRASKLVPGRGQNVFEFVYEFLSDFGVGLAGPAGKPYIPIFVGAFLLIVFDNWIGLVPPVGKIEQLRAPSSDVNITIGMALVSFLIFHIEGFRHLGFGGYLGKFFPFYEFRNGIGAGIIAVFVGLIELMLEFVKPVTLSMRLFGNIYGGEVALGVITALTIGFIPVLLIALELMLNAIQALIFSVLTLMFIVLAIESHHEEEGHIAEDVVNEVEGKAPSALQPSH